MVVRLKKDDLSSRCDEKSNWEEASQCSAAYLDVSALRVAKHFVVLSGLGNEAARL